MPRLVQLRSLADLRQHAEAWDDLWRRSDVTIPTAQAALIEQWATEFGCERGFRAVAVECEGKLVAALPLVRRRWRGVLTAGMMTSNEWTPCGDVLLDPAASDAVLALFARGLAKLHLSLLWLDYAIVDAPRWQRLASACEAAGYGVDLREHFRLPRIDIAGAWETYRQSWSKNHRQNMSRYRRKLEAEHGPVTLRWLAPCDEQEIAALLRRGCEIEDRSWKGAAQSSILRAGMFPFFARQAALLAERGQLEMAFLDVAGQPIAFMYGWTAKGVFHAFKAGYDDALAAYSPGQLLIHDILERFFHTGSHRIFDCLGPASEATLRWQTSDYAAGRVVIAPKRLLGTAVLYAYQHLVPTIRRWRGNQAATERQANHRVTESTEKGN
jgi:CelD/BcsL family acetyltransferase involved in cellulose biosynthesis